MNVISGLKTHYPLLGSQILMNFAYPVIFSKTLTNEIFKDNSLNIDMNFCYLPLSFSSLNTKKKVGEVMK